jgi:hypothetical protein
MEEKIIELISLLSLDNDYNLIESLYLKLYSIKNENEKQKDLSYKYSIENFSKARISRTIFALRKIVDNQYNSTELNRIYIIDEYNQRKICTQCFKENRVKYCDECPFKKRFELVNKIYSKHESIKSKIIENIDSEFLLSKILICNINAKLNIFKQQNYETSKQ